MSLQSAPYWWAVCDLCGVSAQDSGDYAAWPEPEGADDEAFNLNWHVEGGNHICLTCTPLDRDDDEDDEPAGSSE
jgi:hypothetical protein